MPRLGRPALPQEEVRKALIGVRVREDERDLVKKAADAAGKSVSDWAREILVREARRQAQGASAKAQGKTKPRSKRET
jgi:uncharacterized protein (DUF1778 family)